MAAGASPLDKLWTRLTPLRESASDLYSVIHDEERARIKRWEEEKPALESLIAALNQSKDIIKKEKKRVKAELVAKQASNDKEARAAQKAAAAAAVQANSDISDLQRQLAAHNVKLLNIDSELRRVLDALGRQQRPDERDMDTNKLVVLQDTRRLLGDEIAKLRLRILDIESRLKIDSDRKSAEESGWGEMSRLEEQLAGADARIDALKQLIYFPLAKGYRFSGGGGGVFCAAKDLYISEVSGRWEVDIQPRTAKDGTKSARLTFLLGGVSAAADRNEGKVSSRSKTWGGEDTSAHGGGGSARRRSGDPSDPLQQQAPAPGGGTAALAVAVAAAHSAAAGAASRRPSGDGAGRLSASSVGHPAGQSAGASPPMAGLGRLMTAGQRAARQRASDDGAEAAALGDIGASPRYPEGAGEHTSGREGGASSRRRHSQVPAAAEPSLSEVMRTYVPPEDAQSGGSVVLLNTIPKPRKKGEMVAGFLSGLGKKKDKIKAALSGSQPGTPGRTPGSSFGDSGGLVAMTAGRNESGSRLSKFAKALTHKTPNIKELTGRLSAMGGGGGSGGSTGHAERLFAAEAAFKVHARLRRSETEPGGALSSEDEEEDVPAPHMPEPTAGPAVMAAVEAGASRVVRLFESLGDISGSAAGGADSLADADDLDSMLYGTAEPQQSRRGLYVQLLGEGVEILGERGTRIPNVQMKELALELEVVFSLTVNYDCVAGWVAPTGGDALSFDVVQLEHKMRGNSLPLPRAALKALLNMYLPGVLLDTVMSVLPVELGKYIVDSQESLSLAGEFKVIGPVLSTFAADLVPPARPSADAPRKAVDKWVAVAAAAARARAMLGLSEQHALALSELFSGRGSLLEAAKRLSVVELCRFFQVYQRSSMWMPLENLWNKALQIALKTFGAEPLSFGPFMDGAVARICRKPVRVTFQVTRLHLALDADVALASVRDYFERMAKEFYKKTQGDEAAEAANEPLEVQLENLSLWAMALASSLRAFRTKFRSAGCALMASADRQVFQIGAEGVHYDGPLKLQVPLEVVTDADNAFVWDIKLPDRETHMNSMSTMLQEIMFSLSGNTPAVASPASTSEPASPFRRNLSGHQEGHDAEGNAPAAASPSHSAAPPRPGPVLLNPVLGQVTLRKVAVALRLDERRMAELLQSGSAADSQMLATMMGCIGDLFSASLDVGWRNSATDSEEPPKQQCMLTVANNDVTRVRMDVESLVFQSCVSPRISVRVLYAVVAAMTLRFHSAGSYHMRFWDKVFQHLHEYLSKDSLDAFVCLTARADTLAAGTKLRVLLSADPTSNPQGLKGVSPVYLMNEVNLLTVIDTLKLMSDTQR